MAGSNRSPTIMQPIIVGVVLALLVGGSAPWWWSEIGSGGDNGEVTTTTRVPGPTSPPIITTSTTGGTTASIFDGEFAVVDCTITIRNPLVTLREQPDPFGLEAGNLEPGAYPVEQATIVDRGLGPERWFHVAANGRSGWLADNSILIESKSGGCP